MVYLGMNKENCRPRYGKADSKSLEQRVTFEMMEQQIKELKKAADHLLEETKNLRKSVSKSWIH